VGQQSGATALIRNRRHEHVSADGPRLRLGG
jgi:hypothetical protein